MKLANLFAKCCFGRAKAAATHASRCRPLAARSFRNGDSVLTDYRKLFDLTGKTAVVLGAASGTGKSSAEALASLGASVMCADRTGEGSEATAAAIRAQGGSAISARCDAADSADVAALAAKATEAFPRLDIAVTTPGLNRRERLISNSPS